MRKINKENLPAVVLALVLLGGMVWYGVIFGKPSTAPELVFLDVGQGDATLITLHGGVKMLVDAGPDRSIIASLEGAEDGIRYIDLVAISHPQRDHFGGVRAVFERVKVGVLLITGRAAEGESEAEWLALLEDAKERGIPVVTLGQGSVVRYLENEISVFGPDGLLAQSGDLNDTSLVVRVETPRFSALLTGDIGASAERYLLPLLSKVDILKVSHHGSKHSSSEAFLRRLAPRIAVIQVGKNRYGHPTDEAIARLVDAGARVFRNDMHGNVRVKEEGGTLLVFTER